MVIPWLCLAWIWSSLCGGQAVDCFTCSVDFRSEPFDQNNSCLFPPKNGKGKTSCSGESKYCQGIITRINGVFVQIQRTCEVDCQEFCTEKGFGIETSECRFCCNDSVPNRASCGIQGYRTGASATRPHFLLTIIYVWLWQFFGYELSWSKTKIALELTLSQEKSKYAQRMKLLRWLDVIN